ncbi:MAG: hypothetical protein ACK5W9_07205 [Bdellovibrionales bacterium]
MTLEGHEPLQIVPVIGGFRLIVQLNSNSNEPYLDLHEDVIKAYLGLNDGKVKSFLAIIDVDELNSAFQLAQELIDKGIVIKEIRNFKSLYSPGYLVVSHSDEVFLHQSIKDKKHTILDSRNIELMRFMGFSNITIDGQL